MDHPRNILAQEDNFGRVYDCECGSIHIQVGPVTINFAMDAYIQFVAMMNTSAANFENLLEISRRGDGGYRPGQG